MGKFTSALTSVCLLSPKEKWKGSRWKSVQSAHFVGRTRPSHLTAVAAARKLPSGRKASRTLHLNFAASTRIYARSFCSGIIRRGSCTAADPLCRTVDRLLSSLTRVRTRSDCRHPTSRRPQAPLSFCCVLYISAWRPRSIHRADEATWTASSESCRAAGADSDRTNTECATLQIPKGRLRCSRQVSREASILLCETAR